jgi:hypothetical protein
MEVPGKLEVQTSLEHATTITLDGDTASISTLGDAIFHDKEGKLRVHIGTVDSDMKFLAQDASEKILFRIAEDIGLAGRLVMLWLGKDKVDGGNTPGRLFIRDSIGNDSIDLNGLSNSVTLRDSAGKDSITLDGDKGYLLLKDVAGNGGIRLDAKADPKYGTLFLGTDSKAGIMVVRGSTGKDSVIMDGTTGNVDIFNDEGRRGLALRSKAFDGKTAGLWIGANASRTEGGPMAGRIYLRDSTGNDSIVLNGSNNSVTLKNKTGRNSITMDGTTGNVDIFNDEGRRGLALRSKAFDGKTAGLWIGANASRTEGGPMAGKIFLRDSNGRDSISIDGSSGDIVLRNADCAEDFDISHSTEIEPGTVMVIEQEGKLKECDLPYDKRVAGVISGAGNYKPGLVLDKRKSIENRKSISLMGKVYCKVDAQSTPIDVGDLLTTSSTKGHAMKAVDPVKAFGSVIGKALRPLKVGTSLIPILIALQ